MDPTAEAPPPHPPQPTQWRQIAASREFQDLLAIKKLFIIPAFVFFFAYYFSLPLLVGYAPRLMATRVFGRLTLASLYALSQFAAGWLIAWLYLKAATRFDALSEDVIDHARGTQGDR